MHVVFSDLDGTLLDHYTYSHEGSRRGIELLRERRIPLVLVSSKTFREMERIHRELQLDAPLIFENGGGVALPAEQSPAGVTFAIEYIGAQADQLRRSLELLGECIDRPIRTLPDMTVDEIIERTGLARDDALLARERATSIPFVILSGEELDRDTVEQINNELEAHDLALTKGGRFYHLCSRNATKGSAVPRILRYYRRAGQVERIVSVGIGDSENDISLLKAVDRAFLVKRGDGTSLAVDFEVHKTKGIGPEGFTEAIESVFG
jgi:mannosyl-3-phosphoglycerate phosphatase